jgi:hypothetical protein
MKGRIMSDYTLTVPEELYKRVQEIANAANQSLDTVLVDYLTRLAETTVLLDDEEEAELYALRYLSDDALWTIAREKLNPATESHMQDLMDKNTQGSISPAEYTELSQLVERGQRLMLRKSEAAALLTQRGYTVTPKDMANRD